MNPTGSTTSLLLQCQWWAREDVATPPRTPPSDAMLIGTDVHLGIEKTLTGGDWQPATDTAADYYRTWHEWWMDGKMPGDPLPRRNWLAEQAYAYDPKTDTARKLETSNRLYVVKPGEIAGTVDAVRVEGKTAIVVDWKTGQDFAKMTADAEDNWQLKFYALCVARVHNVESVTVMIVRIADEVSVTSHTIDVMELDAVAAQLASLTAGIPFAKPQSGLHCRRCKAVSVCPTTAKATDAIAPVEPVLIELKTPEQATAALVRLRQVQAACEQMESLLKAYAAENSGISLPNGKRWVRVSVERESINLTGMDGAAGISLIHSVGADDAVETKSSTSKAAIERSLKAQGLKGKELRAKADALYSELRACGVMRSSSVETYREG